MPSNIADHPSYHQASSSLPSSLQQRCFQCRIVSTPLLMAASDTDDDIDDTNQRPSIKPR